MKKLGIVLLVAFVSLSFSSKEVEINEGVNHEAVVNIQQEIVQINQIINKKQEEARLLIEAATKLVENNNEKATDLIKQAHLLKMNCLKYQAAIACKERYLLK